MSGGARCVNIWLSDGGLPAKGRASGPIFTLDLRRRPVEGSSMAKTVTIAARVDENLDAALAQLATATGRSKSALLAEALRSYVETEWPLVAALEAGLDVRRTGRFPGHRMAGARAVRGRA